MLNIGIVAAMLVTGQTQGLVHAGRDKPMPPFEMTTISGKTLTNKSFRGKVVLFDFWATWCGPCKAASPAMQRLQHDFGSKGLVVVGADTFEHVAGADGAKKYAKAHGYTYTFTYQNDGLAQNCGIQSIPAFVFMDRKGVVRDAMTGIPRGGAPAIYDGFSQIVSKLLSEPGHVSP